MKGKQTFEITAWSEVLGVVESVSNDELILASEAKYRLKLSHAVIARHKHLLRVGRSLAILVLDNGTVRIREVKKSDKGLRKAEATSDPLEPKISQIGRFLMVDTACKSAT